MEPNRPEAVDVASSAQTGDDGTHVESQSPAVRALERIIAEIAPTAIPVLLVGESGSGKEVAATRIHRLSRRRGESFVKVSCTTAFASQWFEGTAHSNDGDSGARGLSGAGTVFLDEIGDLDPTCQSKLLNIMRDDDAASHDSRLQARMISATRRNLEQEMRCGRFHEELYYRLNGVCLRLQPLRHRKEDIPAFVDFFLRRYAIQFARPRPILSSRTLRAFIEYSWPGNIRQLESMVKKIVALGDESLAQAEMGPPALETWGQSGIGERLSLKQVARAASWQAERELILKALERTHWNRKRAAKDVGISYKALLYKLKQIGLEESSGPFNPPGERE